MAENKKSFIIYTSWKLWLDGLTNEQKGIWLNWMMDYCNDLNPVYPKDQAIKIACMMAQDTLKRDLKLWEEQKQKRSEAGKLGMQKRWHNTDNKDNTDITNDNNVINDITKITDNVNVNVNVNDNVNVVNKLTNNKDTNVSCTEVKEIFLVLPTISLSSGCQFIVYEEDVQKYQDVFIGVDVKLELKKMKLWLESNPRSKKTTKGMPRFINNWLSREQDKASRKFKNSPVGDISSSDDDGFEELGYDNGGFTEI